MIEMGVNYKFERGTPTAADVSTSAANPQTDEDIQPLAKAAQNPIADLISVPFQNKANFGVGSFNRTQDVLKIEPLVPLHLSNDWIVISHTIVPPKGALTATAVRRQMRGVHKAHGRDTTSGVSLGGRDHDEQSDRFGGSKRDCLVDLHWGDHCADLSPDTGCPRRCLRRLSPRRPCRFPPNCLCRQITMVDVANLSWISAPKTSERRLQF